MIRESTTEDKKASLKWWNEKCGFQFPEFILPDFAITALVGEKRVFTGWMYVSHDSKIAFVAYVVANPEATKEERDSVFNEFMQGFSKAADSANIPMIFTTANNGSLCSRIEGSGYNRCDEGVTHFFKIV